MHLSQVLIQNFRGLRRARLDLDHTTVLVGENSSGKSRLIDGLALAMGLHAKPAEFAFRRHDFTRTDGSGRPKTIAIELRFDEASDDQWSAAKYDPLRPVMTSDRNGRRRVQLSVRAKMLGDQIQVGWSFRDRRGKEIPGTADPELLAWLRRLNPLLLLRDGFLSLGDDGTADSGYVDERRDPAGRPDQPADQQELRDSVEEHYRQIVAASPTVSEREIEAGFEAARELVDRAADVLTARDGRSLRIKDSLAEPDSSSERPDTMSWLRGSGAQQIGLLLVVGALLEARISRFWREADPIVIVEDPETHLHPLTLASAWDVVDSVRWQKIVSTHSGDLLAAVPLGAIRRLDRQGDVVAAHQLGRYTLKRQELRKVSYHVRAKRGTLLFARCWLLVEGESEFWILPRLASLCGYDLAVEGVAVVEFAQCGVASLIKLANDLGIQWRLLADGDQAGQGYVALAREHLPDGTAGQQITSLPQADIERCMWHHGYAELYRSLAGWKPGEQDDPGEIIRQAIRRHSKPFLALAVAEAAAEPGSAGVPEVLRVLIDGAVVAAREVGS